MALRFLARITAAFWLILLTSGMHPLRAEPASLPDVMLTPEVVKSFDHRWTGYTGAKRNPGVRDLFNLVLNSAAYNWRSEVAEQALALASQMREPDSRRKLYGNYRWNWTDAGPDDPNAVEFSMQYASLTWMLYRDRLSEKARTQLESEIKYSIAGIRHHRVPVSYTNIFLMKAANCIFIGENLPDESLAEEGYAQLAQWLDYTRKNGVHEYSSPTYYGVDLGSLGTLIRYSRNAEVRGTSEKALRFFWAEIGAHWFPSFEGMAGTHSRDYDFLCGHGILDNYLERAHWLMPEKPTAPDIFIDLSAWTPPTDLRDSISVVPRVVVQRWGENPWEQSTQYVGKNVSLGSAGAAYGAQDKTLTVNLPFGPKTPVVNFAIDERQDPYGQARVLTGGGHMKLTHLVPFLSSVQSGEDALLIASAKPAKKISPFAKSVESNVIFPSAATVWLENGPLVLEKNEIRHDLPPDTTLFLRAGDVAVALRYVLALDTHGQPAPVAVFQDGAAVHAMRFTALHSNQPAEGRAVVAIWIRTAEGLDEKGFAHFRHTCAQAKTQAKLEGDLLDVSAPAAGGTLRLTANLKTEQRLRIEKPDSTPSSPVLLVNNRDLGEELLK